MLCTGGGQGSSQFHSDSTSPWTRW